MIPSVVPKIKDNSVGHFGLSRRPDSAVFVGGAFRTLFKTETGLLEKVNSDQYNGWKLHVLAIKYLSIQ